MTELRMYRLTKQPPATGCLSVSIGQITPIIPITAIDEIIQQLRIEKTVTSLRTPYTCTTF